MIICASGKFAWKKVFLHCEKNVLASYELFFKTQSLQCYALRIVPGKITLLRVYQIFLAPGCACWRCHLCTSKVYFLSECDNTKHFNVVRFSVFSWPFVLKESKPFKRAGAHKQPLWPLDHGPDFQQVDLHYEIQMEGSLNDLFNLWVILCCFKVK